MHKGKALFVLPLVDPHVPASLGKQRACLSGSGSTLLALTTGHADAVGEAMAAALASHGVSARAMALAIDETGAVVVE